VKVLANRNESVAFFFRTAGNGLSPRNEVEARREEALNKLEITRLSTEELWKIHETVAEVLADRIIAERESLDSKLAMLKQRGLVKPQGGEGSQPVRSKRKYPKVPQKYRNPQDHSQTWSGRGKQPHWVAKLLKSGVKLPELIMPQYRKKKAA
jgi:DNA-binding protein H-NS